MVDTNKLKEELTTVGSLLTSKEAIKPEQKVSAIKTLKNVISSLFFVKAKLLKEKQVNANKSNALTKSVRESLITKEEGLTENKKILVASVSNNIKVKQVTEALKLAKELYMDINKIAASPELEKLDKGVASDSAIKAPESATVKDDGVKVTSKKEELKVKATNLYKKAVELLKAAKAEKDVEKKATLERKASLFDSMADKLVAGIKVKKTASVTYAANDKVVLPDGCVATVKSINGNKMIVDASGIEKEAMVDTVKKVESKDMDKNDKEQKEKKSSITDRIQAAIKAVKGSKKVADADMPPVATEGGEPATAKEGDTVSKSETTTMSPSFDQAVGKWMVNKSETEVLSFDSEEAAKAFIATAKKITAEKADDIVQSGDVSRPEGEVTVSKELKGLDQAGKDEGATTKDQKVDPQLSMIAKIKAAKEKKADILDSGSEKKPDSTAPVAKELKGLDQVGKDGGDSTKEQKIDPVLNVMAQKVASLEKENKTQIARLMELESSMLVDRAVKVGAISEEQYGEQKQILAELYGSNKAEFNAYARLIENLEKNSTKATLASRKIDQVKVALERKASLVNNEVVTSSLDNGTLFDD